MTTRGRVVRSVSTWQQPMPPVPGPVRAAVLDEVAGRILALGPRRVRVAIDGFTAAGKTSFGHELARCLAEVGRVVLRATLDDFKRPWSAAHLYDRVSAEGFYRNAADNDAMLRLLLDPSAADGDGRVALCSIDPITQVDHSHELVELPADGIVVVDSVFAFRPPIDEHWDLRIWLDIDAELSVRRGTARDAALYGSAAEAEALHRQRWLPAELLYIAEVDPRSRADVVIDNTDLERPVLSPSCSDPRP